MKHVFKRHWVSAYIYYNDYFKNNAAFWGRTAKITVQWMRKFRTYIKSGPYETHNIQWSLKGEIWMLAWQVCKSVLLKGHRKKILSLARSIFFTCDGVYHCFLHANKQIFCIENCHRNSLVSPLNSNRPCQKRIRHDDFSYQHYGAVSSMAVICRHNCCYCVFIYC